VPNPCRIGYVQYGAGPSLCTATLGAIGCPAASRWLQTCMSVHPLVYQQPQQCFGAPATWLRAWLDGLTDRVRGPSNQFPRFLWPVLLFWTVTGSFQEADFLTRL